MQPPIPQRKLLIFPFTDKGIGRSFGNAQKSRQKVLDKEIEELIERGRRRERKKIGRRLMKSETSSKKWE